MKNILIGSLGVLTLLAGSAQAQDAEEGERVFRKCQACHAVGDDAQNKVGPILNGIVGRAAGSNEEFEYSDAMQAAAADGLVWDEAALDAFLTKPKEYMDGTKMAFPGLRKEDDRANIIAYLSTFGDDD